MAPSNRYIFGDFVLYRTQRRVVRRDGTQVGLTPRLFNALLLLVEHAGELLDKDTLMGRLWPGLVVEENNLSQVVSGLRRALGDDTQGTRFIQTVPRRGFVFVGAVTPLSDDDGDQPNGGVALPAVSAAPASPLGQPRAAVAPTADAPQPAAGAGASPSTGRRQWLRLALGGGAAACLAGAAWWAYSRRGGAEPARGITLAVLPFAPLHREGRDELLEVGMADSLSLRLSRVPGLVVRSTASVLRFGGAAQDPQRAASELDVDWIVVGTLQRRGNHLRASARLLRADSGQAAWTGSFDERVSDVFSVQDQISARVTQALAPALQAHVTAEALPGELGVELGGTRDLEAYQLYLAAAWRAQGTRADSVAKGITLLQQALAIDPDFALAWTLLAWTHRRKLWRNDGVPAEVFASAQEALQRALQLTPQLAQARAGLGFRHLWFDFDWPRAESEFRVALKSNPNEVSAHWGLTQMLMVQGRLDEGFDGMRQVRELDPMSPVFNTLEASYLMRAGSLDEARRRLDRAFDIAPEHGLAFEGLALLHTTLQQPAQAVAAMRRAVERSDGSSRPKAKLAAMLAEQGQAEEASTVLTQLIDAARTRYVPPSAIACVHVALGQAQDALQALERAYAARDTWLVYLAVDPVWAPLRKEPRFEALLRKLGMDGFRPGLMPI